MSEIEKMKKFLRGLDLSQEELDSLFRQLDKSDETLDNWKRRTEAQWKDIVGNAAGVDIYNYLHPRREGSDF